MDCARASRHAEIHDSQFFFGVAFCRATRQCGHGLSEGLARREGHGGRDQRERSRRDGALANPVMARPPIPI